MKSDIIIKENVKIRNYLPTDYQATLKIIKELSNTFNIALNERQWRKSSGLRQFKSNLKRETLVVEVITTGEVIGMGVIEAQKDILGNYIGYLDNWIIKKEYIGKHMGQLLANHAMQLLKSWGCESIRINLRYNTPPKLLKVFKDSGFQPVMIILEKKLK